MALDPNKLQAAADAYTPDNSRLRSVAADSMAVSPDAAARASGLAARNGWRPRVVASDIPGFESEELNRQLDDLHRDHPKVSEWLADDPTRVSLVRDDLEGTSGFAKSVDRIWNSLKSGAGHTIGGALREFGEINPLAMMRNRIAATGGLAYAPPSVTSNLAPIMSSGEASDRVAKVGADIYETGTAEAEAGMDGLRHPSSLLDALAHPGNTAEYYANLGAQSLWPMGVSLLGGPVGGPALAGVTAQTSQYGQDRADGMDEATAFNEANVNAAIEALTEIAPFHAAFQKGQSFLGRFGRTAAAESVSEGVAQTLQDESQVEFSGQPMTLRQRVSNIVDAMIVGFGMAAPMATVGAAHDTAQSNREVDRKRSNAILTEFGRYAASADASAKLGALSKAVAAMKLGTRSPAAVEALTTHLAGDNANVYIAADEFRTLFQQDAPRLAGEVTGNPNALAEAGETGDIVIPLAKYASTLATSPQAEQVAQVARLNAEHLSRKELESTDFAAALEEAGGKPADEAQQADVGEIETGLQQALMATGAYNESDAKLQAKIGARMFSVLGQRSGVGAKELVQRYNLTVGGRSIFAEPGQPTPMAKVYQRGNGRTKDSAQAVQLPDGSWRVRNRGAANQWQEWRAIDSFDPSPAFGYRETGTGGGAVNIPGIGKVATKRNAFVRPTDNYNPLLDLIAENGGIAKADGRFFGLGDTEMKQRRGIRPLFSDKGIPLDRLREQLVEQGYLPPEDPNAPAQTDLNDVWDLVSTALGGKSVGPMGDAGIAQREELARALADLDGRQAEGGASSGTDSLVRRALDAGALPWETDRTEGQSDADYEAMLRRLVDALEGERALAQNDTQGVEFARGQETLQSRLEQWGAEIGIDPSRGYRLGRSEQAPGRPDGDAENADADVRGTSRERKTAAGHRLIEAAKSGGFFIGEDDVRRIESSAWSRAEGAEHDVHFVGDGDARLAIRATANGNFGALADITPAEYLQRLRDYNAVFPSTQIQVFGVSEDADGNAVIWSAQRFVPGEEYATQEELTTAFEARGWEHIGQYPDAPIYRHKATGAIIDDAHTGNVLHIGDELFPIDVVVEALPSLDRTLFQAIAQTETPEFKRWFGDSKVVDANGKPLVVYHGTTSSFDAFSEAHQGKVTRATSSKYGFFFTNEPRTAKSYADYGAIVTPVETLISQAETAGNRGDWDKYQSLIEEAENLEKSLTGDGRARGQNIMPVYLSIQNPLEIDAAGENPEGIGGINKLIAQAKRRGNDGVIIRNFDDAAGFSNDNADHYIAFRPEQIKSATANRGTFDPNNPSILHQGGNARPNAEIAFGTTPDGQRRVAINLFESANKSSFFHESAHLFVEMLGDLAAEEGAPKQLVDDYAAIRKFVGAQEGNAPLTDQQHETFARSFELYLRTGKAPAPELVRPMARIARWLTSIYREVRDLIVQGAKALDPEITAVMDRMLAVDDEIELMEARQAHIPIMPREEFTKLGLTDAQWESYVAALESAADEARVRVTGMVAAAFEREQQAAWKEEARAVREALLAELEKTPPFKLWRTLQAGEKLDLVELKARYSHDEIAVLRGMNIARLEGGTHPDLMAAQHGFGSGDEMVRALLDARAAQRAVPAAAEQEMKTRHPDPAEPAELQARVSKALYGSKRLAALEAELGLLAKLAGAQAPPMRVLAAAAKRTIGRLTSRKLRPNDYLVNERRAAREAMKAAAKQDFALALRHKRDQALQAALYGEARRAQDRAARQAKMLRKAGKPETIKRIGKTAGKSYVDALRALLAGHELTKVPAKVVVKRDALREWVRKSQDAGLNTAVSDDLLARVEAENVTNLADLTLDQLSDLHEAVKNLLHLAAVKNRMLTARGAIEWDEAKRLLQERLSKEPVRHNKGSDGGAIGLFQKLTDAYAAGSNWVLQPETLVEWLDDGTEGPWHDLLWEPSEQAEHAREALRNKVGALLKTAMDALPAADRKALDATYFIPSLGENVTGHYVLSALLNMGNAGNRDKLLRGGRVVGDEVQRFKPEQLAEMFGNLTTAHANLAQSVWDAVNSLWPDIVAMEEAVSGFAPPKVEPVAFGVRTKDGMVALRGGYFPAMYDPRGARVGQFAEDEQAKKVLAGQTPVRAATSKGHLEARTEYAAPLLLDWHAVLTRHLDGVMSDISHRRFLAQAYRILGDADLTRMVDNRFGKGAARGLRNAMERAAVGTAGLLGPMAQYFGPFQGIANATMTNVASAALGLRVPLALANTVTAPILAGARVKPSWLVRGFAAYYSGMRRQAETIRTMSPMMAQRAKSRTTELSAMLATLRGKRGARKRMIEVAMSVHQWIVPLAENAIWLSAYMQSQAGGADIVEATRMADKVIRQTQTKHTAKDLSGAEGGWLRPFMMFAGPMVVINNRLQESGLRRLQGAVHTPTQALGTWIAMAAGGALVFDLIMGRGPDDDDDDGLDAGDWLKWCAKELVMLQFAAYPILRDISNQIGNGFSSGNPLVEAGNRLYRFGKRAVESGEALFTGDDVDEEKLMGSALDAAGVATGIPSSQLKKSGTYLMEVGTGEHTPSNPAKEAVYFMQGPPKDE